MARPGTLSSHFTFVVVLVGFGVLVVLLGFKSNYDKANYRLRECVINLESIAARQEAVLAATGRYLSCARYPLEVPDADKPPTWRPECELDHQVWTWRYENGQRRVEAEFRDGREDGAWASWYENGRIQERGQYEKGLRTGFWTRWSQDGESEEEIDYSSDDAPPQSPTVERSSAVLESEGAEARAAGCPRRWQCEPTRKVCWSPKARQKKDRDPENMQTVPECWRQLMGLGRNMVLRGQYDVSAPAVASQGLRMQRFEATCRIDLKGDGNVTVFRATDSRRTWRDEG